ncbi:MAG TPA: GDP-mannose 4,6-dehydratase [bacterium]|nr:GDP-mannose 4,6-dehydratase [bacterium]
MNLVITGVAGFIGSHLAQRALEDGHEVTGIDCFTDYYPRLFKERNLSVIRTDPRFSLIEKDLLNLDLDTVFAGKDVIYHLAAQAGVRASWGEQFKIYTDYNVLGTQRVLESALRTGVGRVVYASSSSVYGDVTDFPMTEATAPRPVSPYGVTKLAGENLCVLYSTNFGLSTVSLRYFTVYGPRQRPDMAFHKFIKAILQNRHPEIYGNGEQTRDFTFVRDAVAATYTAGFARDVSGQVYNIGGGSRVSVNTVFDLLRKLLHRDIQPKRTDVQKGDVRHTAADTTRAARDLGYSPRMTLENGLAEEIEWIKDIYTVAAGGGNGC